MKKKEREIKQIPYVVVVVPLAYMKVPDTNETELDLSERVFNLVNHIITIRSYDFVYPTYSVVSGGKKDIDES